MKNNKIDLFSGKPISDNDESNYANIITDLKNTFDNEFKKNIEESEKISFTISAWNMACLDQLLPEEGGMDLIELSEHTQKEKKLLKKIVDLKQKKFGEFTRLINDFTLEKNDDEFELSILTSDIDDFAKGLTENIDFDEDFDEYFNEEELQFEEGIIDRNAIILTPKKPFWDWAHTFSPYYSDSDSMSEEINKSNTYLIDEDIDDCKKWLRKNFNKFFSIELENWNTTEKDWPKKRTYKMFKEWFSVHFSTMIYDMEERPVIKYL